MNTPWGHADLVERFAPGFCSVSTPSHGGFRLTEQFAEQHLSQAARERAYPKHEVGQPYWYEEDCAWMIAAWELREYWPQLLGWLQSDSEREDYLLKSLSHWEPGYLQAMVGQASTAGWTVGAKRKNGVQ